VKDRAKPAIEALVDVELPREAGPRIGAEELFRRHAPFVAGFLAKLGVRPQEIEDVVQEVFLVAHRRGGYAEGSARPTTWLAEIALLVVKTRRRTARRRPEEPGEVDAGESAVAPSGPFEAVERAEARARVERALAALDLDHRAVFVLFELDGEPCDAIAASLGVPVGTVYSRLHKARQRFRDAYERLGRDPSPRTARLAAGDSA
jgi:RNA polymerase sigma-70 factor (ECF subfamily)